MTSIKGCVSRRQECGAHIGRDEEVIIGEFEVFAISEDRWLTGEDVVGSHLKNWLWVESNIGLWGFIDRTELRRADRTRHKESKIIQP